MRKFSLIAAALVASVGAFSNSAHAFRISSGYHAPVLVNDSCYFGRVSLFYGPGHPQAPQFAHAASVADNTSPGCWAQLNNLTAFQQATFGHTYTVTDFCSFHPSCPVGRGGALVAIPDRSKVDSRDIDRLREEFRADEYERRLRELLDLRPAAE